MTPKDIDIKLFYYRKYLAKYLMTYKHGSGRSEGRILSVIERYRNKIFELLREKYKSNPNLDFLANQAQDLNLGY